MEILNEKDDNSSSSSSSINSNAGSDNIRINADSVESATELIRILRSAKTMVYFSSFLCQLNEPLAGTTTTLRQLFTELAERGVGLRILYNPEPAYGNLPIEDFKALLPGGSSSSSSRGVEVHCVYGSGTLPTFTKYIGIGENTRYSNHHQKYVCADAEWFMLGGVDINFERKGWLEPNNNKPPYCWHEISVSVRCTPQMWSFACENFNRIVDHPSFPLTRGGYYEHRIICRLIHDARSCIHMEAQTCISAESTLNEVLEAIAQRVARAHVTPGDRFRFILLTNMFQIDESTAISWLTTQQVHWSRRFLRKRIAQLGVSSSDMETRVFIGFLQDLSHRHIKVHSNLIIQDGRRMLRTSSNLTDRSMSVFPCDNELGIVVDGDEVAEFQQKLWRRYFLTPSQLFTHEMAFNYMVQQTGLIRQATFRAHNNNNNDNDKTYVPDNVINLLMDILHLGPWFGGKKPITWNVQ